MEDRGRLPEPRRPVIIPGQMASSPGLIDGKYELLELAGEGGMASVW